MPLSLQTVLHYKLNERGEKMSDFCFKDLSLVYLRRIIKTYIDYALIRGLEDFRLYHVTD